MTHVILTCNVQGQRSINRGPANVHATDLFIWVKREILIFLFLTKALRGTKKFGGYKSAGGQEIPARASLSDAGPGFSSAERAGKRDSASLLNVTLNARWHYRHRDARMHTGGTCAPRPRQPARILRSIAGPSSREFHARTHTLNGIGASS